MFEYRTVPTADPDMHEHDFVQGTGSAEWLIFCHRCGETRKLALPRSEVTTDQPTTTNGGAT